MFWAGMATGVVLSFILTLVFRQPSTVINGKNKVKKGGVIDFDEIAKPSLKRRIFNRKNK